MMMLIHHPLTEAQRREICAWKYEGEYAAYNLPPFEVMKEQKSGFMNPDREGDYRGFSMDGMLIGFVNIREKSNGIFIGIGVHPGFLNRGFGRRILAMTVDLACELHPDRLLYLEVRTWNERAIRCYQHAGFRIDGEPFQQVTGMGKGEFYRMIKA